MNLLIFGLGYSASHFVRIHGGLFDWTAGTFRGAEPNAGVCPLPQVEKLSFDGLAPSHAVEAAIQKATHILVSAPPDETGDAVLRHFGAALAGAGKLEWIGYLSTVGVYGDAGGAWIDETAPLRPTSERNAMRVGVEEDWLALSRESGKAVQFFRLAGIYGPHRNALVNLKRGTARRLVKPGQVFNRIHVEDIAGAVFSGLSRPDVGPFINITDNEPAPPQDVIAYAADLLGVEPPPQIAFDEAELTPMARSFYGENKRVSNRLMREGLGHEPIYPTYREGIKACFEVDL